MKPQPLTQSERLRRSVDEAWVVWLQSWRAREFRPGRRGRRQRIWDEYEAPQAPEILWTIVKQWPKAKDRSPRAHRLRVLFRVLTERVGFQSPEVKDLMHQAVDEFNLVFFDSLLAIRGWQEGKAGAGLFHEDLDPFKRFLLTRWDVSRDGFPALHDLTDGEVAKACHKLLNRFAVSADSVKKARQRLKLLRRGD